jgi:hypothetical protein
MIVSFGAAEDAAAQRKIDFRFGSLADIGTKPNDVRFAPESGHVRCTRLCPLCANSGHSRMTAQKQKDRLAWRPLRNLTRLRLFLPFGLNNWRFALANWSLAFTYATSKAKGENHRADYN